MKRFSKSNSKHKDVFSSGVDCAEALPAKRKRGRPAKVDCRSKQTVVDLPLKTPLNDVNDVDDLDWEQANANRESTDPVSCRRNPTRAKKACRYEQLTISKESASRKNRELSTKPVKRLSHKAVIFPDSDFRPARSSVNSGKLKKTLSQKTKYQERLLSQLKSSANANKPGTVHWTKAKRLIHLSISRLTRPKCGVTLVGHFTCQLCAASSPSFPLSSMFTAHHVRFHTKEWMCSRCSKKFSSHCALVRHRKITHSGTRIIDRLPVPNAARNRCASRLVTSSVDNKKTKNSRPATESSSTYNKCGWCGQKFSNRSKLLEHRDAIHRRPKVAADTSVAKVHRKVIREWSCSEKGCNERFKVKDKLREHMAAVHPSVIFSCPECRFKTQVEHFLQR